MGYIKLNGKLLNVFPDDVNIYDDYIEASYCSTGGFGDFSIYNIYYYEPSFDEKFIDNANYAIIDENNIQEIQELFKKMKKVFEKGKCYDSYASFNIDSIEIGDYVLIVRPDEYYEELKNGCIENNNCHNDFRFSAYFYDLDYHTLYYIRTTT